jgi:hypothetical protein
MSRFEYSIVGRRRVVKVNWRMVMAVATMGRRERAANCVDWPTYARLRNHLRCMEHARPRHVSSGPCGVTFSSFDF